MRWDERDEDKPLGVYCYDGNYYRFLEDAQEAVARDHPQALDDDLPDLYDELISVE